MSPAIFFDADGYVLDGPRLMGRQSAGNGFLRAAIAAHAGEAIHGTSADEAGEAAFRRLILSLDPAARPEWIPAERLDLLARQGVFYRPDQVLGPAARLRLRAGPAAYSLCGVTHTLATGFTLEALADLQTAPVGPWDALICTSHAAKRVVETVVGAQADYLSWRLAIPAPDLTIQLPVIPLGVHCDDFASSPDTRREARAALGLQDDEVTALFAGRLSVNGKAHPIPMFRAFERVATATGRRLVILFAGQFYSPTVERAYRSALAQFCPSVRAVFVNGADFDQYRATWRAADLFVTLADSIQETFGLTPVEAMAAGLPALVSDWDGYRDTVRDGIDGFRITTWAPGDGGEAHALGYEALNTYERHLSQASTAVSLDTAQLDARLTQLVTDEDLRRRMGAAGQARARAHFDWSGVYHQYQALWEQLDARRADALRDRGPWLAAAPGAQAAAQGAFKTFAAYPTELIGPATQVSASAGADLAGFQALTSHLLFSVWNPSVETTARTFEVLAAGPVTVQRLAAELGISADAAGELVARLAKLELVVLSAG